MAKKFHKIGSLNTKKDKAPDGSVQYSVKLDNKYAGKLYIKSDSGKFLPVGDYINVERPTAKYDRMLNAGTIQEAEYEEKVAQYDKDGKLSFVKFELTAVVEE